MKPGGTVFWQALTRTLRAIGMLRLMPSTLALMAVQRHSAASRSASPSSSGQHFSVGGFPITRFTAPSKSTHAPSLSVSLGHAAAGEGGFTAGAGLRGGLHVAEASNAEWLRTTERIRNVAKSLLLFEELAMAKTSRLFKL